MIDLGAGIEYGPPLPVRGWVELPVPVDRMWDAFADVPRWREWNPCIRSASVRGGGSLGERAELLIVFNPVRRALPYRLPGVCRIVDFEPRVRVTWEADVLGFRARHSYLFDGVDADSSRFGSWEVAEGPTFRALHRFWVAHFDYVCRSSLEGARRLFTPT